MLDGTALLPGSLEWLGEHRTICISAVVQQLRQPSLSCATQVWSLPLTICRSMSPHSYSLLWLCYHPYCFLLGYTERWLWSWDNSMQYSMVQRCPWQLKDVTCHSYVQRSCSKSCLTAALKSRSMAKPCPHENWCTAVWDLLKQSHGFSDKLGAPLSSSAGVI